MIRIISAGSHKHGSQTDVDLRFGADNTTAGHLDITIELAVGMSPETVAEKLRTAAMYIEAMKENACY